MDAETVKKLNEFWKKAPPVGHLPYKVVYDKNNVVASFKTLKEAEQAANMYNQPGPVEIKAKQTSRKFRFEVEFSK